MLSARGSQLETDRLAGQIGSGTFTPREGSSLKLAGLDLSNASRQKNKGVDTVPHIRASGKKGELAPWSCDSEIIVPTPRTPETYGSMQRKHKRRTEPGEITRHWGMKSANIPEPGLGYGAKSKKDESAEENFKAGQKLGIAEYVQSRGESIYDTVKREPLGKSWIRGHHLPEETEKPTFKGFGKQLVMDDFDSKEIIFPRARGPERDEDKLRYKRTHGAFEPGEPLDRKYDWPEKVRGDAHFHFGASDTGKPGNLNSGNGAKSALTMDLEADRSYPRTKVVDRTSETYRQVANDALGKGRNMLQARPPVPAGHAFGLKSGADQTHAGELVHGFYSQAEQRPDKDLGKCKVEGRRNFLTKRPFGVPSVRHDLDAPPHHKRSIASATNFGDDHNAFSLIYPTKFGYRGVEDGQFFVRRPKEDIRGLLAGASYQLDDQDFSSLWEDAVQQFGGGEELVSLNEMLEVLGHYMSAAGMKPGQTMARADATLLPVA